MNKFILIFIVLLTSCSTTKKTENVSTVYKAYKEAPEASIDNDISDDFNWIENSDFNAPAPERFNRNKDAHSIVRKEKSKKKQIDSTITVESIQRLPGIKLDDYIKNSDDTIGTAVGLCYQKKFKKAFKLFDSTYDKYKDHAGYWNQIGTCYFLNGELRKSLLFYNKSRDLDKKYAPPFNNLGVIYLHQGLDQKAMAAFKMASEVNTFSMTPLFNLGYLYLKYDFLDRAEKVFKALRSKNRTDIDVINSLALIYLKKGKIDQSLGLYQFLDSDLLRDPAYGINYSLALKMSGRHGQAVNAIDRIKTGELGNYVSYFEKVSKYVRKR